MELGNFIVNALIGLSSAIVTLIGCVAFYPQNKKKKEIENLSSIIESWEKMHNKAQSENDRRQEIIEKQKDIINKLTQEKFEMQKRYNDLEIKSVKDTLTTCLVKKCLQRDPQTGY